MSENSAIEWTDASWNPMRGCSRVSDGCSNCYAMHMAHRFSGAGQPYEGLTRYRTFMGRDADGEPYGIDRTKHQGIDWAGEVRFVAEMLEKPLRWRKPRRVFVNSMSDLFHDGFSNEEIAAVFGVMAACPQHTFQVLTKRAQRAVDWFRWYEGSAGPGASALAALYEAGDALAVDSPGDWAEAICDNTPWPLPNLWLGVSVENQAAAERVEHLLQVLAAKHFISYEPALEDVRLAFWLPSIDWLIAGCESGPRARPTDINWLRSARDQCVEAGTSFFLKQMVVDGKLVKMPHLDGRQWAEVPA